MKRLSAVMLSLLAAGCMNTDSGKPISQTQLAAFKEGATTYAQVVQALGQPMSTSVINGEKTIAYGYSSIHSNPSAASFIPIVGMFATSQASTRFESVAFTFDMAGILKSYNTTSIGSQCDASLVGGHCQGS